MKKFVCLSLSLLTLTATNYSSRAQGLVIFNNFGTSLVRTNASAVGGGIGNTAPSTTAPGEYIYAVLTAPSTVTSVSLSLQELLSPTWSFTGLYGTNTTLATGGRLFGGSGATVLNWAPGVRQSFIVVGWSAELAGQNWSAIANDLSGASFNGNFWDMPNYFGANLGFFGASMVGNGIAGGPPPDGLPTFSLFGSGPNSLGTPITSGFDLYTTSPEPSSAVLLMAGAVGIKLLRRRSRR